MYEGWMIIGTQDPVGNPGEFVEVVNNPRAFAYAEWAGICWLEDCGACPVAAVVAPGFPYDSPISDPAPWYLADDPDSWGFLGVVGLDVSGDDSSTRQAEVKMGLNGIGVIGPTYMAPRTLLVRALAIATDECSLQYGLAWLRKQYGTSFDPCAGDTLTFYDCCPCVCDDTTSPLDCWPINYLQLRTEPPCDPEFWPTNYAQLITGPLPEDNEEWCRWVEIYRELRLGPPQWSCCVDACVTPYLRQFHNVRVTRGPMVLNQPHLYSSGAVAEIEFTVVCGDPVIHAMTSVAASAQLAGITPSLSAGSIGNLIVDVPPTPPATSPYPTLRQAPPPEPTPAQTWVREIIELHPPSDVVLQGLIPQVRVRARDEQSGPVRLGLWAGEQRVAGFTIPYIAPLTSIVVDGPRAFAYIDGEYQPLPAFVRDWDGGWPRAVELPTGLYTLTVDQHPDEAVPLIVHAFVSPVGAG